MTDLPAIAPSAKKLGLVIDLDTCVGCHACAVNCKEWNTGGHSAPLPDRDPYGPAASGVWFNRVHTFEWGEGEAGRTVHFPRSCLHCEEPACVTVCPVGARLFGDMLDPDDPVHEILATGRVQVLQKELLTKPRCYYVGLDMEVR